MSATLVNATVRIEPEASTSRVLKSDMIGVFNSGLVPLSRYQRDSDWFIRAAPEHLRVDLAWGWGADLTPEARPVVSRDGEGYTYDFEQTDQLAALLRHAGVAPYWSYCYVPEAFRGPDQDWRTFPQDKQPWVDMVGAYVEHAARIGAQIGFHEVYNEPDLRDERTAEPIFFAGGLDDYLDLYARTSRVIREADPHAKVGGPSLAMLSANAHWMPAFLDFVEAKDLPLDFVSLHHYGHHTVEWTLAAIDKILARYPRFAEVEVHLNEYNSFPIDYPQRGLQDTHFMASAFLEDAQRFLETPRLSRVSWAQFLDSGFGNYSGMVTIDGQPKPLFYAYEFLRHMGTNRHEVSIDGPQGLGALAASGTNGPEILLWNRSTADVTVHLDIPGAGSEWSLMALDSTRTGDQTEVVTTKGARHVLTMERGAVAGLRPR